MRLGIHKPSFGGHASVLVLGRSKFGLPPGARVHHVQQGRLAFVLLYGRELHALVPGGEVTIPEPLAGLVRRRYFGTEAT